MAATRVACILSSESSASVSDHVGSEHCTMSCPCWACSMLRCRITILLGRAVYLLNCVIHSTGIVGTGAWSNLLVVMLLVVIMLMLMLTTRGSTIGGRQLGLRQPYRKGVKKWTRHGNLNHAFQLVRIAFRGNLAV